MRLSSRLFVFILLIEFLCSVIVYAQDFIPVKRVIDGDTIMLESGERVRLIGVNTPETVHPKKAVEAFGKEASAFTKRTVEGKLVRLEFDPLAGGREQKDRYKRTLAYVFLHDGTHLKPRSSAKDMDSR
jgi:micrococcal nuclease